MVLLVDDNLEQLELRQKILDHEGFASVTADSVASALERCGGCQVVVMDLRMPSLADGLGLIAALHWRAPNTPIIVLAGLPEELTGTPEQAMVRHVLRKGSGVGRLIELLHQTSGTPTP